MSKALSSILMVFACSLACGQTKGPETITVPVGRLAAVPIQIEGDEADYIILGNDVDGLREYDPDPKKLRLRVIGYAPGTAFVVVSSQKGGKLQPLFTVKIIIGGGPNPPVPPGPGPGPTPVPPDPPAPVAGKLFVVIIEETRNAVAARGAWFADRTLKAAMDAKGHKFRVVDKDVTNADGQTPADIKRFVDEAKTKTLPMLYLVNESGKAVYSGAAPVEVSRLIELLTKFGG